MTNGHKASPQTSPFFIVGVQRSGTTMLRLMLNNHPNLSVPFETGFIPIFYANVAKYGDLSVRTNSEKLLDEICNYPPVKKGRLIEDREAILSRPITDYAGFVDAIFSTHAERKGKKRWGDKSPYHTGEMDALWKVLPGCRIVHLIRDGRDVALSLKTVEWGSGNIPKVAEDWCWKTTLAHKIGVILGEHYLEVRYEDLILNPEEELKRVCAFLNEPYHKSMLEFHLTAESEMPKESLKWHKNSVRPPDASKINVWKQEMSLSDRIIFEQVAGSALDLFGYEREHHPSTWGSRLKKLYYCTLKRQ